MLLQIDLNAAVLLDEVASARVFGQLGDRRGLYGPKWVAWRPKAMRKRVKKKTVDGKETFSAVVF